MIEVIRPTFCDCGEKMDLATLDVQVPKTGIRSYWRMRVHVCPICPAIKVDNEKFRQRRLEERKKLQETLQENNKKMEAGR